MSYGNTKTPLRPTGKAKWQCPMRKKEVRRKCKDGHVAVMYQDEYYLTPELEERMRKVFPIHSNRRVMAWFGIGFSTLQRFKRELGMAKDMKAIIREQAKDTVRICEENGWYDSLRGRAPSEACREATRKMFAEGFHPMKQIKRKNPRRYKRLCQEHSERRTALIQSERRRVQLGLSPKTNLLPGIIHAVRPFTRTEVAKRYNALRRGYILGDLRTERYVIFYDSETQRSERFEGNCVGCGFEVRQATP